MINSNLWKRNRSTSQLVLKSISSLLVCVFLVQEVAWANPELKPIQWNQKQDFSAWAKSTLPNIPESVATIEDAYKAPNSQKTVILIQDAHTNNSGQINVSKTLDLLLSNSNTLKYIFLEAGQGNESLSFLRKYAPLEKRKEAADLFLNQGKLQGSEYIDLTSNHNLVLWGVEDMSLYDKSVSLYRDVVKVREKFEDYLTRVEFTIKTLKPRIFNPFLLSFDEKYQKYKKEELSLTDYFGILSKEAERQSISLNNFPHLGMFKKLRELESKIDFKKANDEQTKAIASLSQVDQKTLLETHATEKLSNHDQKTQLAFFALLKEKLGKNLSACPELSKYIGYLESSKDIQAKSILEEQKSLEKKIFDTLSQSEDERNLVKASKNLEFLKKLLKLTLTPEEFKEYQLDQQSYSITQITGFLNRKIMDLRRDYERAIFLESGYEDTIQKCEEFYNLTYLRDQAFLQNMLPKMEEENQKTAVLITGGYHDPNLKDLLKKQNISYVCLTPQILKETNIKRYEELLLRANLKTNQSLLVNTPPISTSMTLRGLTLEARGIHDIFYLTNNFQSAGGTRLVKTIREEIKQRVENMGGPARGMGGSGFSGGRVVVESRLVAARLAKAVSLRGAEATKQSQPNNDGIASLGASPEARNDTSESSAARLAHDFDQKIKDIWAAGGKQQMSDPSSDGAQKAYMKAIALFESEINSLDSGKLSMFSLLGLAKAYLFEKQEPLKVISLIETLMQSHPEIEESPNLLNLAIELSITARIMDQDSVLLASEEGSSVWGIFFKIPPFKMEFSAEFILARAGQVWTNLGAILNMKIGRIMRARLEARSEDAEQEYERAKTMTENLLIEMTYDPNLKATIINIRNLIEAAYTGPLGARLAENNEPAATTPSAARLAETVSGANLANAVKDLAEKIIDHQRQLERLGMHSVKVSIAYNGTPLFDKDLAWWDIDLKTIGNAVVERINEKHPGILSGTFSIANSQTAVTKSQIHITSVDAGARLAENKEPAATTPSAARLAADNITEAKFINKMGVIWSKLTQYQDNKHGWLAEDFETVKSVLDDTTEDFSHYLLKTDGFEADFHNHEKLYDNVTGRMNDLGLIQKVSVENALFGAEIKPEEELAQELHVLLLEAAQEFISWTEQEESSAARLAENKEPAATTLSAARLGAQGSPSLDLSKLPSHDLNYTPVFLRAIEDIFKKIQEQYGSNEVSIYISPLGSVARNQALPYSDIDGLTFIFKKPVNFAAIKETIVKPILEKALVSEAEKNVSFVTLDNLRRYLAQEHILNDEMSAEENAYGLIQNAIPLYGPDLKKNVFSVDIKHKSNKYLETWEDLADQNKSKLRRRLLKIYESLDKGSQNEIFKKRVLERAKDRSLLELATGLFNKVYIHDLSIGVKVRSGSKEGIITKLGQQAAEITFADGRQKNYFKDELLDCLEISWDGGVTWVDVKNKKITKIDSAKNATEGSAARLARGNSDAYVRQQLEANRAKIAGLNISSTVLELDGVSWSQLDGYFRRHETAMTDFGIVKSKRGAPKKASTIKEKPQKTPLAQDRDAVRLWISGDLQTQFPDEGLLAYCTPQIIKDAKGRAVAVKADLLPKFAGGNSTNKIGRGYSIIKMFASAEEAMNYVSTSPGVLLHYVEEKKGDEVIKKVKLYRLPKNFILDPDQRQEALRQARGNVDAYLGAIQINITKEEVQRVRAGGADISNKALVRIVSLEDRIEEICNAADSGDWARMNNIKTPLYIDLSRDVTLLNGLLERFGFIQSRRGTLSGLASASHRGDWTHAVLEPSIRLDNGRRYFVLNVRRVKVNADRTISDLSPIKFVLLLHTDHPSWQKGVKAVYPTSKEAWAVGLIDEKDIPKRERKTAVYTTTVKSKKSGFVLGLTCTSSAVSIRTSYLPAFDARRTVNSNVFLERGTRSDVKLRYDCVFKVDENGQKLIGIKKPGTTLWGPKIWWFKISFRNVPDTSEFDKAGGRKLDEGEYDLKRRKHREVTEGYLLGLPAREQGVEPWLQLAITRSFRDAELGLRVYPSILSKSSAAFLHAGIINRSNPWLDSSVEKSGTARILLTPPFRSVREKAHAPFLRAISSRYGVIAYFYLIGDKKVTLINQLPPVEVADKAAILEDILMSIGMDGVQSKTFLSQVEKVLDSSIISLESLARTKLINQNLLSEMPGISSNFPSEKIALFVPAASESNPKNVIITSSGVEEISPENMVRYGHLLAARLAGLNSKVLNEVNNAIDRLDVFLGESRNNSAVYESDSEKQAMLFLRGYLADLKRNPFFCKSISFCQRYN